MLGGSVLYFHPQASALIAKSTLLQQRQLSRLTESVMCLLLLSPNQHSGRFGFLLKMAASLFTSLSERSGQFAQWQNLLRCGKADW